MKSTLPDIMGAVIIQYYICAGRCFDIVQSIGSTTYLLCTINDIIAFVNNSAYRFCRINSFSQSSNTRYHNISNITQETGPSPKISGICCNLGNTASQRGNIPYGFPEIAARILSIHRIITAIGKRIACSKTLACRRKYVRADKPAPSRAIIPALEVIQTGLYGAYLAVGAKIGGKKMEIIGADATVFIVPGEGLPLSGGGRGRIPEDTRRMLSDYTYFLQS